MQSRELVKLYYRIGEVSEIVGVQPHVLRYWETEFRSIRPQKSSKGQRVYSRRDVEKLLRVKDLLRNQGFTIAGARKRLSEPVEPAPTAAAPSIAAAPASIPAAVAPHPAAAPVVVPLVAVSLAAVPLAAAPLAAVPLAAVPPAVVGAQSGVTGQAAPFPLVARLDSAAAGPLTRVAGASVAAEESPLPRSLATGATERRAKDMRKALLSLRQDLMRMLAEIDATRASERSGHPVD